MTLSRAMLAVLAVFLATEPSLAYSDDVAPRQAPAERPSNPAVGSSQGKDIGDQKAAIISLLLMLARERGATPAMQ